MTWIGLVRCTFGNWACTAGCVVLGQTSGGSRKLLNLRWVEKSFLDVFTDYQLLHRTVWWLGCLLVFREKHFNRRLSRSPPLALLPRTFILPGFWKSQMWFFFSLIIVLMLIQGTCNSMGRVNGTCDRFGCTCSERLTNVFFLNNSGWTFCFSGTLIRSDQFGELVLIWRSSTIGSHIRTQILSP